MWNQDISFSRISFQHHICVANSVSHVIKENFWFIVFSFTFVSASALLGYRYNQPDLVKYSLYSETFTNVILIAALFFLALYLGFITFIANTTTLASRIAGDIKNHIFNTYNLVSVLLAVTAFPLIVSSLTIIKTLLPFIVPYYLDPYLVELDKVLHFGVAPWRIIQPLVGYPYVTFSINVVYNFWFFLQLFVVIWQIFSLNRPRLRMQFLISFVLVWMVLGSFLAIFLASAGPCFYSNITNLPDPYSDLFKYLYSANDLLAENGLSLWALDTQNYLWEHFEETTLGLGSGISAMPSLHVSVAVLLAMVGWRVNYGLGIFLSVYAFVILIGSVHLGWHYAVDGYASMIGTFVIWKFSGYLVRNLPESRTRITPATHGHQA